ncbi:MAG: fluoride efflux transporter CrcB [Paracoccaceae bacterium]
MPVLLQIALGGALGAAGRYLVVEMAARAGGAFFPFGTLLVNVLGSFAMGAVVVYLLDRGMPGGERWAPVLMTGFLGGFTTFSAFSLDFMHLLERGRPEAAVIYVAVSVGLSIGALLVGVWLARLVWL